MTRSEAAREALRLFREREDRREQRADARQRRRSRHPLRVPR